MRYDDIVRNYDDAVKIGEGGQKVVFSIHHPIYGPCVLKIGQSRSNQTLERIRREFSVLASLDSSHFPKCYSLDVVADHRFVVLEQALPGTPLTEILTEFNSFDRSLHFAANLVKALSLLWERRVIHRDVKPANILIGANDHVFVIDLGIARLLDEISLTHTFAARGPCTPVYAAPEQLRNRKHEINHRCDQFAVGIVLAQLLLGGRHPFDPNVVGNGDSTVENILLGNWASAAAPISHNTQLLQLLARMLAREPHARYRTPNQLMGALSSIRQGGLGL